jgi:hypothetical protein
MIMKTIILLLLFIFSSVASSMPLDTSVFRYFPLKVGNRWTIYRFNNNSPGAGFETMKIQSILNANNHSYYVTKYDVYLQNGNLYYTTNNHYRIDSVSGNLYMYNPQTQIECLQDSLASGLHDSARSVCSSSYWYRYDTSSHNIFGQNYQSKRFDWSNYFEAGGYRKYARNLGRVYERNQYVMNIAEYTLRGCVIDGMLYGDTSIVVGLIQISTEVPKTFSLSQNYPNPFNPTAQIEFQIAKSGLVNLKIFDALGGEVATPVNDELAPGTYKADWDASNYPSGVYYYKLTAGNHTESKKMILVK